MRIGLLTLDWRDRIVLFNAAAEQILGYRAREVLGKPCEEIFAGLTELLSDLDDGPETQLKRDVRRRDGRTVPLIVTPSAPRGDGNPPARDGVILVFQDAGDLEKTESQLQHLNRLQSLDEFAAGIVHEIRNPLASISTNAQYMMERIGPSDRFFEEMRDILVDVRGIEDIVRRVLDFAHPSRSQVREVAVAEIVKEVLRLSKLSLRRRNIRLSMNLDGSRATVRVDASQLKQVFFNIVRNACDAMPGGGELRVSATRPSSNGKFVRIEVADTGRGIPEEDQERIFDPFFSTSREGTGLGLAISRKIVESHGGRIEVESRPGRGARFAIVLPTV